MRTASCEVGVSDSGDWKDRDVSARRWMESFTPLGRTIVPLRWTRARDRPIWMYQRQLPGDIRPCCGRVNRGMAILGGKVFFGTLDAHVIALDAKTGAVIWDIAAADYRTGNSFTVAPLAVKNLIIIGVSGGEYGIRGFIDAYDADTGQRKWRFYTVPGPGEPGHDTWEGDSWKVGGAPAWNTGTYDPATNQIFWPTGNPSPSNRGAGRRWR